MRVKGRGSEQLVLGCSVFHDNVDFHIHSCTISAIVHVYTVHTCNMYILHIMCYVNIIHCVFAGEIHSLVV